MRERNEKVFFLEKQKGNWNVNLFSESVSIYVYFLINVYNVALAFVHVYRMCTCTSNWKSKHLRGHLKQLSHRLPPGAFGTWKNHNKSQETCFIMKKKRSLHPVLRSYIYFFFLTKKTYYLQFENIEKNRDIYYKRTSSRRACVIRFTKRCYLAWL